MAIMQVLHFYSVQCGCFLNSSKRVESVKNKRFNMDAVLTGLKIVEMLVGSWIVLYAR